jgi:predicted TIM-barrel fold metal-dependent hydrolase
MRLFELARSLGVAVCAHTGTAFHFRCLRCCCPPQKYPDLPIVMAHAGATLLTQEAIIVASQCENIFLEMSWCPPT